MQYEKHNIINTEIYHNLLDLVSEPMKTIYDFKMNILKLLSESLNFEHYWFFTYSDETKSLKEPVFINANKNSLKEYLDYYQKICTFNPNRNISLLQSRKNVFTVTDVMPLGEFEKTAFYQEHLKRDNYYYTALMYLKYEGAIIGTISATNPKERNFTIKDINTLECISPYIANRFRDYLESSKLLNKQQLFNSLLNEEYNGLIILSDKYSIITYNAMALELCKDIFKCENVTNPLRDVVKELIPKIKKDEFYSSRINGNEECYNIVIFPSVVSNVGKGIETYYMIFISKVEDKIPNPNFSKCFEYNLTVREMEIVQLMSDGKTSKEIGENLVISVNTVRKHIDNIYKKVGEKNKIAVLNKLKSI